MSAEKKVVHSTDTFLRCHAFGNFSNEIMWRNKQFFGYLNECKSILGLKPLQYLVFKGMLSITRCLGAM